MFSGSTSDIKNELDLYYKTFNSCFPLMQASGNAKTVKEQIDRCLAENKKAEELWPEQYGACTGKLI